MRAASVCPHVRECDLLGGALLEEESVLGVEEENGESAVEESLVDVLHQVACGVSVYGARNGASKLGWMCLRQSLTDFLAGASDRLVIVVQYDAHLIHQLDLLLVVAGKRIVVAG